MASLLQTALRYTLTYTLIIIALYLIATPLHAIAQIFVMPFWMLANRFYPLPVKGALLICNVLVFTEASDIVMLMWKDRGLLKKVMKFVWMGCSVGLVLMAGVSVVGECRGVSGGQVR